MFEQYSLAEFEMSLIEGKSIHSCNRAVLDRVQWMCPLNVALCGRDLDSTISRDELFDLLALASSDADALSSILSKNPSLFKNL
jgi:hypothetical protein